MKRIVCAAQHLVPGANGISRVARLTIQALEQDHHIRALAVEDRREHSVGQVPVQVFGGSRLGFALSLNSALLHATIAIYDFPGTARAHLPRWRDYAVWVHGNEVWNEAAMRQDYVRAIRRAKVILVNSTHTGNALQDALGHLPQLRLCWLATEDEDEPEAQDGDGPPLLLFMGRSDAYFAKGQDILVKLWPRVVVRVPGARLRFVGGGPESGRLDALIKASPAAGSIEHWGFVPEEQLESAWRGATALALLSSLEGFGLVIVEAMRRGVPIIASNQDAGSEINLDAVTGFNLEHLDDDAVVECIAALLENQSLAGRLGRAGRERWRRHFRPSAFRKRLLSAIEPLLGE